MAAKKEPKKVIKTVTEAPAPKPRATRRMPIQATTTADNRRQIVLTVPPMRAPKFLQGFVDFVRTQGVVGLAVGLVLGVAAKSVVDSLVANVFNPLIGMVGGGSGSIDGRFICLKETAGACTNKLGYGNVVSTVMSFLIVAGIVYFVVKGLKLDKLDKSKEAK
jgi:large conductance mechanosensitive channel